MGAPANLLPPGRRNRTAAGHPAYRFEACNQHQLISSRPARIVVRWPSGLRRYVQVVVSSGAWVRTPPSPVFHFCAAVTATGVVHRGGNRGLTVRILAFQASGPGSTPGGCTFCRFRHSIVVRTPGSHPGDPGSIPGGGRFSEQGSCSSVGRASL